MVRTNRKRKAKTLDTFQGQYFYPIYKGWVLDKTFIFDNPTAALCFQLSRYKKDLLLYSYSSHPKWLHCIAHLHPSHEDDVELTLFESKSSIERRYFSNTKFYHIPEKKKIKSMVVQVDFRKAFQCDSTFLNKTDYMSSSASIYNQRYMCIQDPDPVLCLNLKFNSQNIPQKRDDMHYISLGHNAKKLLKGSSNLSSDSLIQMTQQKLKNYEGKEIILSMGCGNGATELLSEKLCLCLDVDRRSIFSGMIQLHRSENINSSRIVFGIFDYSKGLSNLCSSVKSLVNKEQVIKVLFQHPTPSSNEGIRKKFCSALRQVRNAMIKSFVTEAVFVYDFDENRNTWTDQYILDLFFDGIESSNKERFTYSRFAITSNEDDTVTHPIFGNIKKLGWGKMRNCTQSSIIIKYN